MNDYPVKNFTGGRPWGIKNIVIHHVAGIATASQIAYTLNSRGVSAHYGIGNDGSLGRFVGEENRAWHAGDGVGVQSRGNDMGIGIEVSNSEVGGDWKVSEQSFGLLVEIVKDIAKRNGLLPLKVGGNLLAHRDLSPTQCCGNFLYGRLQELADKVNATEPAPEPEPQPPTPKPETSERIPQNGTFKASYDMKIRWGAGLNGRDSGYVMKAGETRNYDSYIDTYEKDGTYRWISWQGATSGNRCYVARRRIVNGKTVEVFGEAY